MSNLNKYMTVRTYTNVTLNTKKTFTFTNNNKKTFTNTWQKFTFTTNK